ncbi:MAG: sugar transporter [Fuerstiella sp.]|nr:sugar transporter [Fuerstiella sp.]
MRIVQFEIPGQGRRTGIVEDDAVIDLTSVRPAWLRTIDIFHESDRMGRPFSELPIEAARQSAVNRLDYQSLLSAHPGGDIPFLHPPLDAADLHRVTITGTGLTHLGSMQSRDSMHAQESEDQTQMTDSAKMFAMGLRDGKPTAGRRGVSPEWFYKGNGHNLRGHHWTLQLPGFADDGGEEAEIVGCYVIDLRGIPRRIGFALGNEWSDHATERINYLYLAPSKLRQCAVGPELVTDLDFQEQKLHCEVIRDGETIYESGELLTGEQHMCHSLANCEDHHFKYPQHRIVGDVHLHFFGTSKLSYGERDWKYQEGDEVRVIPDFGAALINTVHADGEAASVVAVQPV